MIALGKLHLFHKWIPELEGTLIRINFPINSKDNTKHGKSQIVSFVSIETQLSIIDMIKSFLDGNTARGFANRSINQQHGIEMCLTEKDSNFIEVCISAGYIDTDTFRIDECLATTTITRETLDIFCGNLEVDFKKHEKELKLSLL